MISVKVESLTKIYPIYAKPLDSLKEIFFKKKYSTDFCAVNDISLELQSGQSLGIVGENGAGKSTLLKLLAGVIAPSKGRVDVKGRLSAILELGAGFHQDLSGLENIKISCSLSGLSAGETRRLIPQIIDFSELGDFIDRPVKTYSSGMVVRLGFSIAVAIEPDVLIVDEALSVGDQHFQTKSLSRMLSFKKQGKTMLFCSHNLFQVRKMCDQCAWIKDGRIEKLGPVDEVVEAFQNYQRKLDGLDQLALTSMYEEDIDDDTNALEENAMEEDEPDKAEKTAREDEASEKWGASNSPVDSTSVDENPSVAPGAGGSNENKSESHLYAPKFGGDLVDCKINTGENLVLEIRAKLAPQHVGHTHCGVLIKRNDGLSCYAMATMFDGVSLRDWGDDSYGVVLRLDNLALLSGEYFFEVYLVDETSMCVYDRRVAQSSIIVSSGSNEIGVARIPYSWA